MIVVVGASHRTAPLAVREALAVAKERLADALHRLRAETEAAECVLLSTCNRVEAWVETRRADGEDVVRCLAGLNGLDPAALAPHLYRHAGDDALRHVFEVAASLDSMVLGESQILGQVRAACEAADEAGTLGPALAALRDRTLAAAKRVRAETEIGRNAVSVSHVAVELARKVFGDLAGRNVLLVGTGKMSKLAARQLTRDGARLAVMGRQRERADAAAATLGGRATTFDALRAELSCADVVICGTGAPHAVVTREDVAAARVARGGRPQLLVDIASPRDVEPAVRDVDGVFLYDLDDLKSVAAANLGERGRQAASARAIVAAELRAWADERRARRSVPLLVALRERAEAVRRAELERAAPAFSSLTAQQRQAVEAASAAIVNKLLHAPTVYLKDAARRGDDGEVALAGRLLGLDQATPVLRREADASPATLVLDLNAART